MLEPICLTAPLEDIKRGGGGKNSRALVASYPALTFFLKKVCCMGSLKLVELGKHIPVFDEAYEIHNMYSKRSLERLSKFN